MPLYRNHYKLRTAHRYILPLTQLVATSGRHLALFELSIRVHKRTRKPTCIAFWCALSHKPCPIALLQQAPKQASRTSPAPPRTPLYFIMVCLPKTALHRLTRHYIPSHYIPSASLPKLKCSLKDVHRQPHKASKRGNRCTASRSFRVSMPSRCGLVPPCHVMSC